ncbi:MAG: alanine dehydrogenase, partial [Flavobacteriales bacterium]
IRLIDYETLVDKQRKRLVGFGRYAGMVGAYEGFRAFGMKHKLFELKAPLDCHDRSEMEQQLERVVLPRNARIVLTGFGRVGNGAEEIMRLLPIRKVSEAAFLNDMFDEPVYTHLDTSDYYAHKTRGTFDKQDFYSNPAHYMSTLADTVKIADLYIACHLWAATNPILLTRADMENPNWKCKVIADISCDVNGPIPSTLRASTIASPLYGYLPTTGEEVAWDHPDAICVMAIDNLPCGLPRDASEDFGEMLINSILPHFFNQDAEEVLWRASETTLQGELTPHYEYLREYANSAH